MTRREDTIKHFLQQAGFSEANIEALAGDASFRSYRRLEQNGDTYVLMDAPPEHEDVRPFVALAAYLAKLGLSAPEVLARDFKAGLLVLEDFGDGKYSDILNKDPGMKPTLYSTAIDVLAALHKSTPPKTLPLGDGGSYQVPEYNEALLFEELSLFPGWYLPELLERKDPDWNKELEAIWRPLFRRVIHGNTCLTLRDYHADNLMWLPEREGVKKAGLLDFQDAVIGHPAYDLVSLLQDARRPFDPALEEKMITRYLDQSGRAIERDDFMAAYQILGAQRNAKIIGIFTRLWRRDSKPQYPKMIPHVWSLLEENLKHPALKDARAWFDRLTPKGQRS